MHVWDHHASNCTRRRSPRLWQSGWRENAPVAVVSRLMRPFSRTMHVRRAPGWPGNISVKFVHHPSRPVALPGKLFNRLLVMWCCWGTEVGNESTSNYIASLLLLPFLRTCSPSPGLLWFLMRVSVAVSSRFLTLDSPPPDVRARSPCPGPPTLLCHPCVSLQIHVYVAPARSRIWGNGEAQCKWGAETPLGT